MNGMNRKKVKRMAYRLSKPFPLKWLRQLSGQNFIFPFYHLATDNPSPCIRHLLPVPSVKQFINDLDLLLKYFTPADYPDVLDYLNQDKHTRKARFFLSFDDGFAECFHVVAPILKRKGLPAAFFINPAFVDNKQLSHRQMVSLIADKMQESEHTGRLKAASRLTGRKLTEKDQLLRFVKSLTLSDAALIQNLADVYEIDFEHALNTFRPYMELEQIRQLKSDGFVIGSHSLNHAEFNLLSEEEMKKQIEGSFRFLETNLKTESRLFSFPFSDTGVPSSFFDYLVHEARVAVSFGTAGIKHDDAPRHLQRIPFEMPGFNGAEAILRSEYFYYFGKAFIGKNRIRR
jgi:peptidoglycan/xylan/chitin deacetylase (PgdA/CDA1 family)